MSRKFFVLMFFAASLVFQGYGNNLNCNDYRQDCDAASCPPDCVLDPCEDLDYECEDCNPCYTYVPWLTYTYFHINDARPKGLGKADAQNAILGFDYYFKPCVCITLFGTYEHTKNTSPVAGATAFLLGRRAISKTNGWGGGVQLTYQIPFGLYVYANYSYVSIDQRYRTQDLGGFIPNILSRSSGHRWQTAAGLTLVYPFCAGTFTGNVNYLYLSNHSGGFVDSVDQELTGQNATLGIGSANGIIYLLPLPRTCVRPFFGGGVSYDINRSIRFPIFTSRIASIASTFPLRARFEWNGGAGLLLTQGLFTFSAAYSHKGRPGPINIDIVTLYASVTF